jgi:hypothetical protein
MLGASGPAVGEAFSGERLNEITERIIGSSILVHRATDRDCSNRSILPAWSSSSGD